MSEALTITISAKDAASGIVGKFRQGVKQSMAGIKTAIAAPFNAAKKVATVALRGIKATAIASAAAIGTAFAAVKFVQLGANLALIRKAFENLTHSSGQATDTLITDLQRAASNTMTQAQVMAKANQLISVGMNTDDIKTLFEFTSKKAIAIGKDVTSAINTMATGLARGSVLMLDDFGILMKGAEGVRDEFNRLHGEGAFQKLAADAQKALIVKAALAEMKQGITELGITGSESAIGISALWANVKDLVASFSMGISESDAFGGALEWVNEKLRNVIEMAKGFNLDHMIASIKAGGKAFFTMPEFAKTALKHVAQIVITHAKWLMKSWWEIIKGGASILWEPIKYAALSVWTAIKVAARDAASGILHAFLAISSPVARVFGWIADSIKKPLGNALVAVGQMIENLQERFPDIARIPGLENLGEKIVSIGANVARSQPMKAVELGIDNARKKLREFDADTQEIFVQGQADKEKAWADMWDNIFEKGDDAFANLKKAFEGMTADQKKELAELAAMFANVMPAKAGKGGSTSAAAPASGGGGGEPPPAAKKAYGWLERAGKGLSSAADRLGGAGGGGGLGAMGGGGQSARQQKRETMVQKELKAMAKGVAGGMGNERQAARREAQRRVSAERQRRQEAAFSEKEGKLADAAKSGLISKEEADAAREKAGKETFGGKNWEKRKERQSKESQREKLADEFGMKDWKKKPGKAKDKGKKKGDVPEGGDETGKSVEQLQAALLGKLQEMIANDKNAAQQIKALQAAIAALQAKAG